MYLLLDGLTKKFPARGGIGGDVSAVDNVTLQIEKGQFFTLLGPSGCGKTTTLRLIAGFEFPTSGRIELDGQRLEEVPPNRRDMAMVFQSYAIFPHLNVMDNICYGLKIRKLPPAEIRRKAEEIMRLTRLTGLEDRAPNQLSGGQQQRVALARAMAVEPKVLLFDEPLSNLDAKLRVSLRFEIRRLQKQLGITSVYVTHDQAEAMSLSDQVVVMNAGRVEQVGTPDEVYMRPANRFVADFIGRANFLPARVTASAGDQADVEVLGRQMRVPARVGLGAGTEAMLMLRPEVIRLTTGGEAVVKSATYLGSTAEYEIAQGDQQLAVTDHEVEWGKILNEGDRVTWDFDPHRAYILR